MMIDKRLIRTVRESKKYIAWNVIYQWISLVANITMMVSIADLLSRLFANTADRENFVCTVIVVAAGRSDRNCRRLLHRKCRQKGDIDSFQLWKRR